jgi:DNA-binding transcriptional regulator PaaX
MKNGGAKKIYGAITNSFLDCLLGLAEGLIFIGDRKKVYKAVYGHFERELTVEKIRKHFDSLKRRGYVEITRKGGKESIKFTNKAKLHLLDKIAERIPVENKYYFVSFDIPERIRRNRDLFRRAIKRLGFREVQKSLWVCNKNVGDFIELAAKEYEVSDYVVYLISDNTNINDSLFGIINGKYCFS